MIQNTKYKGVFSRDLAAQSVPVAYTQIISNAPFSANFAEIFYTGTAPLRLGTGATGNESEEVIIFPSGTNGTIQYVPIQFSIGTNLYLRAYTIPGGTPAAVSTGTLYINFLG